VFNCFGASSALSSTLGDFKPLAEPFSISSLKGRIFPVAETNLKRKKTFIILLKRLK
jgi:hypothetical protein